MKWEEEEETHRISPGLPSPWSLVRESRGPEQPVSFSIPPITEAFNHRNATGDSQNELYPRIHPTYVETNARTCPFSRSTTFPTTSTSFPICRCESGFKISVTSPLLPHVIVAVSPFNAETVPSRRTVCVPRAPDEEGAKA